MGLDKNKTYTLKPYDGFLYQWSPQTDLQDPRGKIGFSNEFCNAVPYSNGKDLITKYTQKSDGSGEAYVACDYWE